MAGLGSVVDVGPRGSVGSVASSVLGESGESSERTVSSLCDDELSVDGSKEGRNGRQEGDLDADLKWRRAQAW